MLCSILLIFQSCKKTNKKSSKASENPEQIAGITVDENTNGIPEYLGSSLYKPISVGYRNIPVKEFSENWIHICIFTKDNISNDDKVRLADVEADGTYLDLKIEKEEFTIVSGLFEEKTGSIGTFIAKIDFNNLRILQVKIVDENRNKIFYLEDQGNFCYIVKRLYSSAALIINYDDISVIHEVQYD